MTAQTDKDQLRFLKQREKLLAEENAHLWQTLGAENDRLARNDQLAKDVEKLITAAQALIDRWDSPMWKEQEHTGEFIHRLRLAVIEARH